MSVWIKELLKNMDAHVDEPVRRKIMEACGAVCPYTHLPDDKLLSIKEAAADDAAFMDALCETWRLRNENGHYYVVFDQCYCPLVNEDLTHVSSTLCHCTLGNLKRKFAVGLDRDVDVIMEGTILTGARECRFRIEPKG